MYSPAHVTLKTRQGVPSLRSRGFVSEFKRSLREASERGEFRVVHYSLQRDHVHLIVEAAGRQALGRGMKSIGARFARAINRVFGRTGPALLGRYHVRALRTPREVRNALAYVLLNVRRHWKQVRGAAPPVQLDEASSGRWFDGWSREPPGARTDGPEREVAPARTWLLSRGWRRHRLVDPSEVPGGAAASLIRVVSRGRPVAPRTAWRRGEVAPQRAALPSKASWSTPKRLARPGAAPVGRARPRLGRS